MLERGSIVTLNDTTDTSYVLYYVLKIGVKKLHRSLEDDNPAWKLIDKEA